MHSVVMLLMIVNISHTRPSSQFMLLWAQLYDTHDCMIGPLLWVLDAWLTHWGWVTHICVGNRTIIGSDNGLSPCQRLPIIWTNAGILLIGPLGTDFGEISIKILIFLFKKMRLKVSSANWRPFCLGLNVLTQGSLKCVIWLSLSPHTTINPILLTCSLVSERCGCNFEALIFKHLPVLDVFSIFYKTAVRW